MFRFARLTSLICVLVRACCVVVCLSGGSIFGEDPSTGGPLVDEQRRSADVPATGGGSTRAQNMAGSPSKALAPAMRTNAVREANHEQPISDAKSITDLQRAVKSDQMALQKIEADLAKPDSEYHQAEAEFKQLDASLEELKKNVPDTRGPQDSAIGDGGARSASEIENLQARWKLAKSRFELAIQERKTTQEKAATLKQKIQQEQQKIDKLTGAQPSTAPAGTREAEPSTGSPSAPNPEANPAGAPGTALPVPAATPQLPPAMPADPTSPPSPPQEGTATTPTTTPAPGAATPAPSTTPATAPAPAQKRASKELVQAIQEAEKTQAVAQEAEEEVQSGVERMELLRRDIELELKLLDTTRKKADIAVETEHQLREEYEAKLQNGAPSADLADLRLKLAQAKQRSSEARSEARERVNRIDDLQSRYATLQSEQIVTLQEAERKRSAAESAQKNVEALRNPFTVRNMLQWLLDHGPRLVFIFLAMLIGLWMTRVAKKRIIDMMMKRGGQAKRIERENRAQTLVGVFENAATVGIVSGGALMILDTVGIPITTLMGGAAVFGLAIAFGAQSLIKDYFYGFMILLEQQYTINDVVKVGDIAGQVERITLRVTVLRDLEGRVHFIPHGAITSITNMTHGWSRALFDIGVAYKEDADRVIDLVKQLGREMRCDPYYKPLILEDLTMLGVDAFNDSAVVIKFFIKTRPLKQWEVKRELLRRIKKTFDEQGIEIPFPHRTVYHRHLEEGQLDVGSDGASALRRSA